MLFEGKGRGLTVRRWNEVCGNEQGWLECPTKRGPGTRLPGSNILRNWLRPLDPRPGGPSSGEGATIKAGCPRRRAGRGAGSRSLPGRGEICPRPTYSAAQTALTSVYCSNTSWPISRPQPDCLYPPKGRAASKML